MGITYQKFGNSCALAPSSIALGIFDYGLALSSKPFPKDIQLAHSGVVGKTKRLGGKLGPLHVFYVQTIPGKEVLYGYDVDFSHPDIIIPQPENITTLYVAALYQYTPYGNLRKKLNWNPDWYSDEEKKELLDAEVANLKGKYIGALYDKSNGLYKKTMEYMAENYKMFKKPCFETTLNNLVHPNKTKDYLTLQIFRG